MRALVILALLVSGCASRDAPTKSSSDAAVDSNAVESDTSTPSNDSSLPVDTALPDTAVALDTAPTDANAD